MKYVNIQRDGINHLIPFSEVVGKFNYLFITEKGRLLGLAEKIKAEGNDIKINFKERTAIRHMQGLVGNWESWKNWADVIVYDDPSLMQRAEIMKKNGYLCIDFNSLQKQKFEGKLSEAIYKHLEGN